MLGMNKVSAIGQMLVENARREHAHAKGVGLSHARMIKNAKDIPEVAKRLNGANGELQSGAASNTGKGVRMLDGKPMVFYTDGSIRHAAGRATTKAARKQLKKARQAKLRKP